MPKSKNRKKKKKKPIDYSSQKNRKNTLERNNAILKKRMLQNAAESNLKIGKFKHSVSELILDYGKIYIDEYETETEVAKIIGLLIFGWNIGSIEESLREQALLNTLEKMNLIEIESFIRELVDRKITYYDEYKYIVTDYELSFGSTGGINLSVASAQVEENQEKDL